MSDGTLEANLEPLTDSTDTSEKKESLRKMPSSWINPEINQALSQALESWKVISDQVANKRSPDEDQLLEVKKILEVLKSKIEEFTN